jgi:TonB family protein
LKTNPNISPDTIKAYLAGSLSQAQTHAFEKAMLNDAVLRDMVDGYQLLAEQKLDLHRINASLSANLQSRIEKENTKLIPLWGRIPTYVKAASVFILVVTGLFFLLKNDTISEREKIASQPVLGESVASGDALPKDTIDPISKENIKTEMAKIRSEKSKVVARVPKEKEIVQKPVTTDDAYGLAEQSAPQMEVEVVPKPAVSAPANGVDNEQKQAPASAPLSPSAVMKSEEAKVYPRRKSTDNQVFVSQFLGTVLDEESKKPVPNVSILANEKTIAKTDNKGQFTIENADFKGKVNLIAPDFENTEVTIQSTTAEELFIRPKAELIFIDLKRNKTWKYNPSEHSAQPTVSPDDYADYLKKNLRKPKQAIEKQIVGSVTVEFLVNKEGKLLDFKIVKSLGYGCDEEAIRVIKEGPNWMPKVNGGVARRQRVIQEISFQ